MLHCVYNVYSIYDVICIYYLYALVGRIVELCEYILVYSIFAVYLHIPLCHILYATLRSAQRAHSQVAREYARAVPARMGQNYDP